MMQDKAALKVFNQFVQIQIGDGASTLFWRDKWYRGRSLEEMVPLVVVAVSANCANKRTVQEALMEHSWVRMLEAR